MKSAIHAQIVRSTALVLFIALFWGCESTPPRYSRTYNPHVNRALNTPEPEELTPEQTAERNRSNNNALLGLGAAMLGVLAVHEMTKDPSDSTESYNQREEERRRQIVIDNQIERNRPK